MCVYSMVIDHYKPHFDPWTTLPTVEPFAPQPDTGFDWTKFLKPSPEIEQLRQLIAEFKQALAAAKTVDKLTSQPDCEDPEKAKLVERVAALERRIDDLTKPKAKRQTSKTARK